jgi:hypothetical protein
VSWNPLDTPVDKAILGGKQTPGLCEITGANSPRNWDERDGFGLSGALLVFRGVKLSHFSISFKLLNAQDWDDWHTFAPTVAKPPLGKRPRSLDISHPITEEVGIRSVVVDDVLAPVQADDGVWIVEIRLIEFRKPVFALAKPQGSTATPVDPVELEIQANNDRIVRLLAAP